MPPLDIFRQAIGDMGFNAQKWGVDPNLTGIGKWGADPNVGMFGKWGIDPTAISMSPSMTGMNTVLPGTSGMFSGGGASSVVSPPPGPSRGNSVMPASSGGGGGGG